MVFFTSQMLNWTGGGDFCEVSGMFLFDIKSVNVG